MLHTPALEKVQEDGLAAWSSSARPLFARDDTVKLYDPPNHVTSLFSDTNFTDDENWCHGLRHNGDLAIYVSSLGRIEKFTLKPHPKHLKPYGDQSIEPGVFARYADWSEEVGYDFCGDVSGDRLGKVRPNSAVCLGVAVRHSVALYQYLRSDENVRGPENPNWVFENSLFIPAVYRIGLLDMKLLSSIRAEYPAFNREVTAFCGQFCATFVEQCAMGHTLTYKTALLLKAFLENLKLSEANRVGEIHVQMGAKNGKTIAAPSEVVVPSILPAGKLTEDRN